MTDSPVHRSLPGQRWEGIDLLDYKPTGSAPFKSISRQVLIGDETLACELRYFEIAAGGHSTLERHEHAHGVLVLSGRGACLVGGEIHAIGVQDLVRIPPWTWHQFRADADSPLGFLCMVNRARDRPVLPTESDLEQLCADPAVAACLRT